MDIVGAMKKLIALGITGYSELGRMGTAFNIKRYIDVLNAIPESKAARFEESAVVRLTKLLGLYVWMSIISLAITFISSHFGLASLIGIISSAIAILITLVIYAIIIELIQKHKDNIPCFVILIGLVIIVANIVGAVSSIVGRVALLGIVHSIKTLIWIVIGGIDIVIMLALAGEITNCTFWKNENQG